MQVTIIDTYTDKAECNRMWDEYAEMLRNTGQTPRYAVRRKKVRVVNRKMPLYRLELVDRGEEKE
jgi:hypothetical protein